ncbi:hypothetical protein H0Z60_08545 [Ectothiorhodospiraceae bacterium WFHF3C12]|nr:hypothetical protein [Ectothiorhodospiraceae bacterium WFHF3C12]
MPAYHEIRSELKTGDLILFSGKGAVSNLIKLFSGGKWSHVGMVLRMPAFDDAVLLWESTTLGDIDHFEFDKPTKGVQLVPLSQRLSTYRGEASWRQLSKPLGDDMVKALAQRRKELSRRPYERNEIELLRAAWDRVGGTSGGEDLSSVFCSELVAEAYQAVGLLEEYPKGLPSNEYTPIDFSDQRGLKLKGGYNLGEEVAISG